jgi:hypothetical protein
MLTIPVEHVQAIVDALHEEFGDSLSGRVTRMIEGCVDPSSVLFPGRQRAGEFWLPDLASRPWYAPTDFGWTTRLEAASGAIASECHAVASQLDGLEYYLGEAQHKATPAEPEEGLLPPAHGWKAFFLRRNGVWRRRNCELCPTTTALVRSLPLSTGDVMFSVLKPHSKIVPHHGLNNLDLTCHLGVDVPSGCGLEVDGETRSWSPGRALIFDDTFRHWAWNRSDVPRIVLLFDFWHPGLSRAERAQLVRAVPRMYAAQRAMADSPRHAATASAAVA